jgi:hypothetical protein
MSREPGQPFAVAEQVQEPERDRVKEAKGNLTF